jgi:hypothetical protein
MFTRTPSRLYVALLVAGLAVPVPAGWAATFAWSGATNGNMSGTAANWGGTVPGGTDVGRFNSASYTNAPTANADQTMGELLFDTSNTGGVTFGAGAFTLTLNGVSGVGLQLNSGSGAVNTGSAISPSERANPGLIIRPMRSPSAVHSPSAPRRSPWGAAAP